MKPALIGLFLAALLSGGCLPGWMGTPNDITARSASPKDPDAPAPRVPVVSPDEVDAGNVAEKVQQFQAELQQEQKGLAVPARATEKK
jgi:hypothetical protein